MTEQRAVFDIRITDTGFAVHKKIKEMNTSEVIGTLAIVLVSEVMRTVEDPIGVPESMDLHEALGHVRDLEKKAKRDAGN